MNTNGDREQRIRERAYRLWEQAGQPEGREEEFWHQATAEIEAEDNNTGRRGPA